MIENRFIHINEKEKFEELKPEIQDSSIAFCKESSEIYTHGEEYGKAKWEDMKFEDKAGDIVFWTGTKKKIVKADADLQKYKDKGWTPIGVVVIPTSHNVYGMGEGAMISLKYMNYDTPEDGGERQGIYWGPSGTLGEIRTAKPKLSDYSAIEPTIVSNSDIGYFPSDEFTYISGQDKNSGYDSSSGFTNFIPSPYLTDGSRNPLYYDTDIVTDNVLSVFNGKEVSERAWNKIPEDIKNQDSIANKSSYYPAFWACHKYHTEGTEQGDWFLPSMGEIGYMMARFKAINLAIDEINKVWTNCGVVLGGVLGESGPHWSASELSSDSVWYLRTSTGYLWNNSHKYSAAFYVRAFCRIK